jgi:TPP-dependent indolepyruvate ferredoxin oxidoreductase alpha subunit
MFFPVIADENICEGCGTCYSEFSCPAIGRKSNGQAKIYADLCNGNGSCIQVCPVSAIVRPPRDATPAELEAQYADPEAVVSGSGCTPDEKDKQ